MQFSTFALTSHPIFLLILDIDPGFSNQEIINENGVRHIWVSEAVPGGGGIIESSLSRLISDPEDLTNLVARARLVRVILKMLILK